MITDVKFSSNLRHCSFGIKIGSLIEIELLERNEKKAGREVEVATFAGY